MESGAPQLVLYSYDERDRLLVENGIAGPVTYGWDANGNQTAKSGADGATYVWDLENRLIRVELTEGTIVEHTYDVDGTRVRTRTTPATGPPVTVDYLVDPWHQTGVAGRALVLSQVVAESDATTGELTAYHVRGDDLLATLRPEPGNPAHLVPRYLHAEGIGTIRALTDETGAVTDRYTLEAFGTLLDHQGDDPNAYLFAGEPLDPNSGFYYNRARWLDSRIGRFATADRFLGGVENPVTLHLFVYAGLDPMNVADPSGYFWWRIGWAVHNFIGEHFTRLKPGFRLANYFPISSILGIPTSQCGVSERYCRLKPDLVDLETHEVYEIKPGPSQALGFLELSLYLAVMQVSDPKHRNWDYGFSYRPPKSFFIPTLGGFYVRTAGPSNGVILYDARSRIVEEVGRFGVAVIGGIFLLRLLISTQLRLGPTPSPIVA
ncbi:MAG: RHS repeat-associated core domain-containing protein [Thermoanaerobaculia bacterium]